MKMTIYFIYSDNSNEQAQPQKIKNHKKIQTFVFSAVGYSRLFICMCNVIHVELNTVPGTANQQGSFSKAANFQDFGMRFAKTDQTFLHENNLFACESETELRWLTEASSVRQGCDNAIKLMLQSLIDNITGLSTLLL